MLDIDPLFLYPLRLYQFNCLFSRRKVVYFWGHKLSSMWWVGTWDKWKNDTVVLSQSGCSFAKTTRKAGHMLWIGMDTKWIKWLCKSVIIIKFNRKDRCLNMLINWAVYIHDFIILRRKKVAVKREIKTKLIP